MEKTRQELRAFIQEAYQLDEFAPVLAIGKKLAGAFGGKTLRTGGRQAVRAFKKAGLTGSRDVLKATHAAGVEKAQTELGKKIATGIKVGAGGAAAGAGAMALHNKKSTDEAVHLVGGTVKNTLAAPITAVKMGARTATMPFRAAGEALRGVEDVVGAKKGERKIAAKMAARRVGGEVSRPVTKTAKEVALRYT